MKRIITIHLLFIVTFCNAQNKVEKIDLKGRVYTVTSSIPKEILGTYYYEETKQPLIVLNADGSGYYEIHDMTKIQIKYWIDCDENGVIRKRTGENGRYEYTVLYKITQNPNSEDGNNAVGKYDLMDVFVAPDLGYMAIWGERIKKL